LSGSRFRCGARTRVTVDTTVQPNAITFPTDGKQQHAAIKGLNRLARECGLQLRQSCLRIAKRAAMTAGRHVHANEFRLVASCASAHAARPPHPRYPPQNRRCHDPHVQSRIRRTGSSSTIQSLLLRSSIVSSSMPALINTPIPAPPHAVAVGHPKMELTITPPVDHY
jgi:hypothetical protein